jgi:hypothetical protein
VELLEGLGLLDGVDGVDGVEDVEVEPPIGFEPLVPNVLVLDGVLKLLVLL